MMRHLTILCIALASFGCGDDFPVCKEVINTCVDPCDITCDQGEEEACVGRDFGDYDIGENERCCICIDPDRDYANE